MEDAQGDAPWVRRELKRNVSGLLLSRGNPASEALKTISKRSLPGSFVRIL
jgi:hypothetical protein